MEHFLNQSLVVHYLLQLGKTMTIECFLLLRQWSRVKTKDLGHGFWRYYFKIYPFQMDLVGLSSQTNKRHAFILFYVIITLSCNEG